MELRKILSYCAELRREARSQHNYFCCVFYLKEKFGSHLSLPSRIKEWRNYKADRCCHIINTCKIIKSDLQPLFHSKKNVADPNTKISNNFLAVNSLQMAWIRIDTTVWLAMPRSLMQKSFHFMPRGMAFTCL